MGAWAGVSVWIEELGEGTPFGGVGVGIGGVWAWIFGVIVGTGELLGL